MKLYVIRHGETTWNVERKLQGASDTELNENGIALAIKTGKAMKEIPFDLCFTSPLKRARHTAQLVLGDRKEVPVIEDVRLREISLGSGREKTPDYCGQKCSIIFFTIPKHISLPKMRNH